MPSVAVAMRSSLQERFWTSAMALTRRDSISDTENTFSSWDNCMAQDYCKWPVIVGIIIGGLIVLSILTCIIRCACCGMSCCCSCFSCLACCGDCCGACTPRHERHKPKNYDNSYRPPNQGYQPPAPMMAGGTGIQPAQFATFEVGPTGRAVDPKPIHEDALPPMPSWDTASKRRVMEETEEKDAVELENLDHNGQNVPLISGAASSAGAHTPGSSQPSPFGPRPGQGGPNGYMAAPARSPGPQSPNQDPYARHFEAPMNPGYPQNGYSEYDNRPMNGEYDQSMSPSGPGGQDPYFHDDQSFQEQPVGAYGQFRPEPRYGSPASRPGPPNGPGYRGMPQRQYSNESGRPYPANGPRPYPEENSPYMPPNAGYRGQRMNSPPQRMRSPPQNPPQRMQSPQQRIQSPPQRMQSPPQQMQNLQLRSPSPNAPPLQNNGGFDFSGGSAPARGYGNSPPPMQEPTIPAFAAASQPYPTSASNAIELPAQPSYPGQRAYSPPAELHGADLSGDAPRQALMPGRGLVDRNGASGPLGHGYESHGWNGGM